MAPFTELDGSTLLSPDFEVAAHSLDDLLAGFNRAVMEGGGNESREASQPANMVLRPDGESLGAFRGG